MHHSTNIYGVPAAGCIWKLEPRENKTASPHQDLDHSMELASDPPSSRYVPSDSLLICERGLSLEGRAWILLEEHSPEGEVDISK